MKFSNLIYLWEDKKMRNKKTKVVLTLTILAMSVALSACGHEHEWEEATCTTPKTCVTCGETEGEALGHKWNDATCTTAKVCSVCGETEGEALGHEWNDATCTTAKTCSVCGETEGEALGHEWSEATCTTPKTCNVCGITDGDSIEHTLDSNGKCTLCGNQIGFALNLSNYKQYLNVEYTIKKNSDFNMYEVDVTAEPLKNVIFKDVIITFEYTLTNSKYKDRNGHQEGSLRISEAGYCSGGWLADNNQTSGTSISDLTFAGISGYVIE
jgi:hypothetical protein